MSRVPPEKFELRPGSGQLWENDRRQSDSAPDFTGKLNIDGKLLRIVGWRRTSGAGKAWLSLRVSEDRPRSGEAHTSGQPAAPFASAEAPARRTDFYDDDIPF